MKLMRGDMGVSAYSMQNISNISTGGAATVVSSAWAIAKLGLPFVPSFASMNASHSL